MAWARVQSAGSSVDAASIALAFSTANLTAGNKLIAFANSSTASGVPAITSVKDGAGNTFTQVGAASQGVARSYIFAMDVPAGDVGTKPTITALWASGGGLSLVIQEVSGLLVGNTIAMIDGTAVALTGTAAATGSPAYTTTVPNEYLVSGYADGGNGKTLVIAGGWTADASNRNSDTSSNNMVQYKNSTNALEAGGYTAADTAGWAIVEVAFKLAAAGGPVSKAAPIRRLRGNPSENISVSRYTDLIGTGYNR